MTSRRTGYLIPWYGFLCVLFEAASAFGTETVTSPDGRIAVTCGVRLNPRPDYDEEMIYWTMTTDGISVIQDSPLFFEFVREAPLGFDVRLFASRTTSVRDTLVMPWSRKSVEFRYNEMNLRFQEKSPPFRIFHVVFRISNDGMAFRTVFPNQAGWTRCTIAKEHTRFHFASDFNVFAQFQDTLRISNEGNYRILPLAEIPMNSVIGLPLLVDTRQGLWAVVTEAGVRDYAGMSLATLSRFPWALESRLEPRKDDPTVSVVASFPIQTPWRVILIGDRPGSLIESRWMFALNDSCQILDPSWIAPGKCLWPGWPGPDPAGGTDPGTENAATRLDQAIRFASEQGLQYVLVDPGLWGHLTQDDLARPLPGVDMEQLCAEAKNRGVGLWLALPWEVLFTSTDVWFPRFETWGLAGIRVDLKHRDDQDMNRFVWTLLRKAAEAHLMVGFRNAPKPTGLERTFPNLVAVDAVLGQASLPQSDRCDPEHTLLVPFTRMTAGPMDFTLGFFQTALKDGFLPGMRPVRALGTRCRQLAMYVVYESPIQTVVDDIEAYSGRPEFEFLKTVPTIWDQTIVLDAEVGKYIVVARKLGREWYIGAITDWSPRELRISLSFLEEGAYNAEIYSDRANIELNPMAVLVRNIAVSRTDLLTAPLGPGGGYAVRLIPK